MSEKSPDQWWADNHDDDAGSNNLMEQFKQTQSGKMERQEELEKARHALELAKLEAEALNFGHIPDSDYLWGFWDKYSSHDSNHSESVPVRLLLKSNLMVQNLELAPLVYGGFRLVRQQAVIVVGAVCMLLIGGLAIGAMNEEFLPIRHK